MNQDVASFFALHPRFIAPTERLAENGRPVVPHEKAALCRRQTDFLPSPFDGCLVGEVSAYDSAVTTHSGASLELHSSTWSQARIRVPTGSPARARVKLPGIRPLMI
jgi:hypothetical protein